VGLRAEPREVAAVQRGAYMAYPGADITVRWTGEYPRHTPVVVICDR
jgi:hypothetical protein